MKKAGMFKVYKKIGALQAKLIPPTFDDRGHVQKEGVVLIEVARGIGEQQWDWSKDKKITFAISYADISVLLDDNKPEKKFYHEYNGVAKGMEIIPGRDRYEGTYQIKLSMNKESVVVPFTNGEWKLFMRLLLDAVPLMVNWTVYALASRN